MFTYLAWLANGSRPQFQSIFYLIWPRQSLRALNPSVIPQTYKSFWQTGGKCTKRPPHKKFSCVFWIWNVWLFGRQVSIRLMQILLWAPSSPSPCLTWPLPSYWLANAAHCPGYLYEYFYRKAIVRTLNNFMSLIDSEMVTSAFIVDDGAWCLPW